MDLVDEVFVVRVEPIREHHRAKVDVVGGMVGAMDNNGPDETVNVLRRVVAVPPRSTVKLRTEAIREGAAGRNRALRNTRSAVHIRCPRLQETVPVERCTLAAVVLHRDLNPVTPVGLNHRSWELVVHGNQGLRDSIGSEDGVCNGPVILSRHAGIRGLSGVVRVAVACSSTSPWIPTRHGTVDP